MAPPYVSPALKRLAFVLFNEGGVGGKLESEREKRLAVCSFIAWRTVESTKRAFRRRLGGDRQNAGVLERVRRDRIPLPPRRHQPITASGGHCVVNHPPTQTAPMGRERRRIWVRMVLGHPDLTAAHKTVLLALETYADYETGRNAFPGEVNLCKDTGLKPRAVRYAIQRAQGHNPQGHKDECPPDCEFHLCLIDQTRPANSRAGKAAVYRLTLPAEAITMTGTTMPVNDATTGTTVPVDNPTTGTTVPVNGATTGTATHHDRHGHDTTTGTAVPPTLHAPSKYQSVESDRGTSPGQLLAVTHTDRIPSEFCDLHPHGYRGKCGDCGNARTFKREWLAQKAAQDVAIATAEDYERAQRRKLIAACQAAGGPCDDFGRIDFIDDDGNHVVKPCHHPNVTGIEHAS